MISIEEKSNLICKDEPQSDSSDYSYNTEDSYNNSTNIESSNPLSIQNLLNRHDSIDFQSFVVVENDQDKEVNLETSSQINNQLSSKKNNQIQPPTNVPQHNVTLEQFIEYLNLKINGDKYKKITKDTLNIFYKQMQLFLNLGSLTRSEKRSKMKVFMKLYRVHNSVIYFLECKPHVFLDPILLHIKFKISNRKKYQIKLSQNNQTNNCLNQPSESK